LHLSSPPVIIKRGVEMTATGLSHFNLRAPRELMERLRSFYCEVVGLSPGERPPFESFGYWLYAGEQAVLHLSETRPGESCDPGVTTTFDHAAFSCTGRADFECKLVKLGIAYATARVPGTSQVQLFIRDPAGNGVELNFANEDI
jgi:catechol-2,3-dioxygenase